jgi:hypothetical protein
MACGSNRIWYGVCTQAHSFHECERGDFTLADDLDAERKARLRAAIIWHLLQYPYAGDTPEGMVACWLPQRGYEDAPHFIASVVETMVVAGELVPRPLPDGSILYVRGPALSAPP